MMKYAIPLLAAALAAGAGAIELNAPHMTPTPVTAEGALQEDWGTVALACPGAEAPQVGLSGSEPYPVATATWEAGGVTVAASMYRAPIWPGGADVIEAVFRNPSGEAAAAALEVRLPEGVSLERRLGRHGGRAVIALPGGAVPIRETREWGCVQGGAETGWGRPAVECDPAFENIRVGYGSPIVYLLPAPPEGRGTVAVGLLESHWALTGQRVLDIYVEGGGRQTVDPVAEWGQHRPGVLLFNASDRDGDGTIEVVSAPAESASDQNAILNALWVFPPDAYVDASAVAAGERNGRALCYADAGGEPDPSYYKSAALSYEVELAPQEEKTLVFLLASPGSGGVPDPGETAWTAESLRASAERVWRAEERRLAAATPE